MSVKTPQIIPYLYYEDVPAAIEFLTRAFGFVERLRVGTPRGGMHAELGLGDQIVMLGQGAAERGHGSPHVRRVDRRRLCVPRRCRRPFRARPIGGRRDRRRL